MTFKEYISSTAGLYKPPLDNAFIENPEQDFIADATNDLRFPDAIRDWDHLECYLILRQACPGAIAAGRAVWDNYRKALLH